MDTKFIFHQSLFFYEVVSVFVAVGFFSLTLAYPFKEVTKTNYDTFLKKTIFSIIQFTSYDPECSHYGQQCKKVHEMHSIAVNRTKHLKISLGTVNCNLQMEVCDKNHLKIFPILFLYKNGQKIGEYGKQDSSDYITQWILEYVPRIYEILDSKREIEEFIKQKNGASLIGYFKSEKESDFEHLMIILKKNLNLVSILPVGIVFNSKNENLIELHSKDLPNPIQEKDIGQVGKLILKYGFNLVEKLSEITDYRVKVLKIPKIVLYLKNEYDIEDYVKLLSKISSKFVGKLIFTYSDMNYDTLSDLDDEGADIEKDQILMGYQVNGSSINFKEKIEIENIMNWCLKIIENKKDEL